MRRCGGGTGRSRWDGRGWRPVGRAEDAVAALADALERQSLEFGAGAAALENIAKIRAGARAVVTGQQVGLLGGPLYVLLKAATAIARAKQATAATGVEHVPMFWLATEDHDLEEVDQVSLLTKTAVETLRLSEGRARLRRWADVVDGQESMRCWSGRASCWGMRRCASCCGSVMRRGADVWGGVCAADGAAVRWSRD